MTCPTPTLFRQSLTHVGHLSKLVILFSYCFKLNMLQTCGGVNIKAFSRYTLKTSSQLKAHCEPSQNSLLKQSWGDKKELIKWSSIVMKIYVANFIGYTHTYENDYWVLIFHCKRVLYPCSYYFDSDLLWVILRRKSLRIGVASTGVKTSWGTFEKHQSRNFLC